MVKALGMIGGPESLETQTTALKDKDLDVRKIAAEALSKISLLMKEIEEIPQLIS